jgi:hypothetical protein
MSDIVERLRNNNWSSNVTDDLQEWSDSRAVVADIIEKLVEALQDIARQKLWGEIDEDEIHGCDFEGAYEEIVKVARAALAKAGVQ